ncbi:MULTISPECIES: hypothetical protein [unclassified Myroides]|uniref:hypothetical protein n=1 Tax=unclassified Myroides TaxID=2642485 RepID=UPI003D2F703E
MLDSIKEKYDLKKRTKEDTIRKNIIKIMKYYLIKNREMPWGDYGNILFAGLLKTFDENYNDIDPYIIERIGPYIPDIYVGDSQKLVVKKELFDLFLIHDVRSTFKRHKILIKKFIKIDWQSWDPTKPPEKYPRGGEPYNYIKYGHHNEDLLKMVSKKYYGLNFEEKDILKIISDNKDFVTYTHWGIVIDKANEEIMNSRGGIVVNEKVKDLIEKNTDNCLRFIELQTV